MNFIKKCLFIGTPVLTIPVVYIKISDQYDEYKKNVYIDNHLDYIIKTTKFIDKIDDNIYVYPDIIENMSGMYIFYRYLNTLDKTTPLNLYIETEGGDINGCLKVCTIIKEWNNTTNVHVKKYALSSGTIIALCADNLYLDDDAYLSAINICGVRNGKVIYDKKMLITPEEAGGYIEYMKLFMYIKFGDINNRRKIQNLMNKKYNVPNIMYNMYDNVDCHFTYFDKNAFIKISSI